MFGSGELGHLVQNIPSVAVPPGGDHAAGRIRDIIVRPHGDYDISHCVDHETITLAAGGVPVALDLRQGGFQISKAALEAVVTQCPIRLVDGEWLAGSATFERARENKFPAMLPNQQKNQNNNQKD